MNIAPETVICQIHGGETSQPTWDTNATGLKSAGNICPVCLATHQRTGLFGEALRGEVARLRGDAPRAMSLHARMGFTDEQPEGAAWAGDLRNLEKGGSE